MVKFSTHFIVSFQTHKPRQIKVTSPKPSTTYYTPSSLAFTISFHVLVQPDIFTLRQNYSLRPSFFCVCFFLNLLPVNCLPSCFSDNTKTFNKNLTAFFFQQSRIHRVFSRVFTTLTCYTLKTAIFLIGSKTVWLGFTW